MKTKKINIILLSITLIILILGIIKSYQNRHLDTIIYNNEKYIYLEYNTDIFTYLFNSNEYLEEDLIHPISHKKWNMVYFNGDLFIHEKERKKAIKYYANDKNYNWFIVLDEEDETKTIPITLTKEELEYIYDMDNMKKSETMKFEEIKKFADLTKISKDKTIFALISLAYCKDSWYWKTEIMTEGKENSEEYIIKLPDSLKEKITSITNNNLN